MKEKTTVTYIAEDGTEFTNKHDCSDYERDKMYTNMIKSKVFVPTVNGWQEDVSYRGAFVALFKNEQDVSECIEHLRYNTNIDKESSGIVVSSFPSLQVVSWDGSWYCSEPVEDVYDRTVEFLRTLEGYMDDIIEYKKAYNA